MAPATGEEWSGARTNEQENIRGDTNLTEQDAVKATRTRLLKRMCIVSVITVLVSLSSIVVGIFAWLTSDSKFPYVMTGGAICGGCALLLTICPFCMYCEGKRMTTGTTSTFKCCLIGMMIWFSFAFCGMAFALGMSGVWGIVECDKAAKEVGHLSINACTQHTNEKLSLSILTLILCGILLILSILILCIFCCNTKAFGYKTVYQRRHEFYEDIRREAREEALREFTAAQNVPRNVRDRDEQFAREPTAPPLEDKDRRREHKPYNGHRSSPRDYNRNRNRAESRDNEHRHSRPRREAPPRGQRGGQSRGQRERNRDAENRTEEPPPKYDEVINTYLKADDV